MVEPGQPGRLAGHISHSGRRHSKWAARHGKEAEDAEKPVFIIEGGRGWYWPSRMGGGGTGQVGWGGRGGGGRGTLENLYLAVNSLTYTFLAAALPREVPIRQFASLENGC